jgi:Subtilase family
MRRASSFLAAVLFATAAFAVEPVVRTPDRQRDGLRHVIIHANAALTPADRAELAEKGLHIQRAASRGRYLARVAEGRAIEDARIARIETIEAEKKIASSALREARRGRTWAEVNVYFHRDVTIDDARETLLAAGAALDDPLATSFGAGQRLGVKIAPSQFSALAADDRVLGVTGPFKYDIATENARAAALSHVTELHQAPYGLTGAGVTVSLFELARAQGDHIEFGGRLTVQDSVIGGSSADASHATHVAGTIGASGLNADAKGMAPGVRIYQLCVRGGGNQCRRFWLDEKATELAKLGSRVDNNSWGYILGWEQEDYWVWNDGGYLWGAYELELVAPLDEISLEQNVLFVHSAGNEARTPSLGDWGQHRHVDDDARTIAGKLWCYSINGSGTDCPAGNMCNGDPNPCEKERHHPESPYDTIGLVAASKNSLTVGAVASDGSAVDIAGFSSRGPAKDGRIKPEVVARGQDVLSSVPTNSYGPKEGTSMSSPVVTGIAALLVEQWRRTNGGADPNPVQLKALLIAGADDLGRPGPDYTFGFGLVNAKTSADLIIADAGTGARVRSFPVAHGSTTEIPVVVSSPQNVRVVLQWGDPAIPLLPGVFIADKALVNDLDVKVVGPNGTEYLPYVLDPSQFEKLATKGVNNVDNTEMVEIANAAPGTYRVVVTGRDVPEGPQTAVIVTNTRTARACSDLTENRNNSSDPYGDLTPGQTVNAAICSAGDADFFRFTAAPGPVSVTVTTGDTALNVTAGPAGATVITEPIPANTTRTITLPNAASQTSYVISVSASGTLGAEPFYSITPNFKAPNAPRRRSARH